jgi:transposase
MKTNNTPSVVSTSPAAVVSGFTLGLDLGDRQHHVCVLDTAGQIVREASLPNTRPALVQLLADFPRATVAVEAGTHSPWISRYLTEHGASVLVANPRKLHAISRSERKCDRRDAQMLARLARVDAALLHPIQHGSAQAQHDLLGLKLRDALVRTRVSLIHSVRFTLKSLGHPIRNPSSESFHKTVLVERDLSWTTEKIMLYGNTGRIKEKGSLWLTQKNHFVKGLRRLINGFSIPPMESLAVEQGRPELSFSFLE